VDKKIIALIIAFLGVVSMLFLGPIMWNFNIGLGYLFLAVGVILLVLAAVVALKKNK